MAQTLGAFITEMMKEFGLSETNSNEGTSPDAIRGYVNDANADFINQRNWSFNLGLYSFLLLQDTILSVDLTLGNTTATFADTSGWANSGKVNLENNIINYSNNAANVLTITAADANRNHRAGENASLLYAMPADYAKPAEVSVNKTPYLPEDIRSDYTVGTKRYWQHHFTNPADGVYSVFMQLPKLAVGQICAVKYSKRPVDLVAVANPETYYLDVPNPKYRNYVKFAVMGRIYTHLEELAMAEKYQTMAALELKQASAYDAKQHSGNRVPLRTSWDNPAKKLYGQRYGRHNQN
jgi:hypothetical protein